MFVFFCKNLSESEIDFQNLWKDVLRVDWKIKKLN
jgi:hypothetical protein